MKTEDKVKQVHRYIEAVSGHDLEKIRSVYSIDATVEDPVGSGVHSGIDAICAFYRGAFRSGVELELAGPVRCGADFAAFPFVATTHAGKNDLRIDVIDVFEFDSAGKVRSMRAYWGPGNCEPIP